MTIDERMTGQVTILDLQGRLTIDAAGLLKDKIHSLLFQGRRHFVLNLDKVTHIDSTGLGEIVATYMSVARQNGRVGLVNLTKRVHDLLTITKLLSVFDVFDAEADAVLRVGAPTIQ